jgi:hypothetical protein
LKWLLGKLKSEFQLLKSTITSIVMKFVIYVPRLSLIKKSDSKSI